MNTNSLLRNGCLSLGLLAGLSLNAQTYTTQLITPPPGTSGCTAVALNNNGAAVGRTTVKVGSGKKATTVRGPGFLWENGVSVVLPPLPGQPEAEGAGVSDAGLVVGGPSIFMQATLGRATWWADTGAGYQPHDWNDLVDPSAGITLFGTVDISADGQYVGFRTGYGATYGGDVVAKVQLGANGLPVSIEDYWPVCDPWGLSAVVHDGGGLVLATGLGAPDVADPGTWLWVKNGDIIQKLDLHSATGEANTDGWDVNIHGEIAGTRRNSSIDRAVVWSADGTMLDIGTLGGAEAMAFSINDSKQVVGWSLGGKGKNSGQRAFLWDPNGMVDLNTRIISGPTLTQGRAINNAGQILCWSSSGSVLLTP